MTAVALARATRPEQLLLALAVAALGAAMATARGAALTATTAAVAAVALLATWTSLHLANEWADHETDRLTTELGTRTRFSGGSETLPGEDVPRRTVAGAAVAAGVVGLGLTVGAWAAGVLSGGAAAVQVVTAAAGYAYSLPPVRLAWRGLGEVANSVAGGVGLPLYGYGATAGVLGPEAVWPVLPFTALVFGNLLATQWPDRRADGAVGKRSLAVRWSARRLRVAFTVATVGAYAGAGLLLVSGRVPETVALATFLGAPLSAWAVVTFTRRPSPFPAVAAMVVVAVGQLAAWAATAGLL